VLALQKYGWGPLSLEFEGGPTPPPLFFRRGVSPHPLAGQTGGHPPPPSVPVRPSEVFTKSCKNCASRRIFHTKYRCWPCKNTGGGHSLWSLVGSYPLLFFFWRGVSPHPAAGQAGGHTCSILPVKGFLDKRTDMSDSGAGFGYLLSKDLPRMEHTFPNLKPDRNTCPFCLLCKCRNIVIH